MKNYYFLLCLLCSLRHTCYLVFWLFMLSHEKIDSDDSGKSWQKYFIFCHIQDNNESAELETSKKNYGQLFLLRNKQAFACLTIIIQRAWGFLPKIWNWFYVSQMFLLSFFFSFSLSLFCIYFFYLCQLYLFPCLYYYLLFIFLLLSSCLS